MEELIFILTILSSLRPSMIYIIPSWRCYGFILDLCDCQEDSPALLLELFITRYTLTEPVMQSDYLLSSLTTIEGLYPGCGILLTGDFNQLNISRIITQFKLKQLVHVPTRGDCTLDLIITNMTQFSKEFLQIFPPFGLSDHSVVLLKPKSKSQRTTSSRRFITRRDTRYSRKCELGRYLGSLDWSVLDSATNCKSKLKLFQDLVKIDLDTIMPLKTFKFT